MAAFSLKALERYRIKPGTDPAAVKSMFTADRELFQGEKREGRSALKEIVDDLKALQRVLWADHTRSLLVVLQGMDTAGKDGAIRKTFGPLNPQGVTVSGFKEPTREELGHDFLWRIHRHTPEAGQIAVFNRSHYEDVLVVRVHGIIDRETCLRRYRAIRDFERNLVEEGTSVVKFFLNISREEQKERLQARLDDPDKNWKFSSNDLKERKLWDDYQAAYSEAVCATSTEEAPWYAVPSDRKWYRDLVISSTVHGILSGFGMSYPPPEEGLETIVIE